MNASPLAGGRLLTVAASPYVSRSDDRGRRDPHRPPGKWTPHPQPQLRFVTDPFFERPILNSPYERPGRHWELDDGGQPTQRVIERRRSAKFITPIPKPRRRRGRAEQQQIVFDEGAGLSTAEQQYDLTALIDGLRGRIEEWRRIPDPADWRVTPETARLLQHWRHHPFSDIRPFFCQVEAVETAIWLAAAA